MRNHFVFALFATLLALFHAGCGGGRDANQPLAACFEYGEAIPKDQVRLPVFVLYTDGTLIYRRVEGEHATYKITELTDAEMAELAGRIVELQKNPSGKEAYALGTNPRVNTLHVFFDRSGHQSLHLTGLKALEIGELRVAPQAPDLSGDGNVPDELITYITTLGMMRPIETRQYTNPTAGKDQLFPAQERWNALDIAPATKLASPAAVN